MVASSDCLRHHHHPFCTPIHSVGSLALSNRGDLYLLLSVSGDLDRPIFSMARGRELSDELRLANLDCACWNHPLLDPDEDPQLHPDFVDRWGSMGHSEIGRASC